MFNSPYTTTPCSSYNVEKIQRAIQEYLVEDTLFLPETVMSKFNSEVVDRLHGITDRHEDVPPFAHPMVFEASVLGDKGQSVFLDLRPYTKVQRDEGIKIQSESELHFLVLRGILQYHWSLLDPVDLLNVGQFPLVVYIRWLTDNISRRLNLDPGNQITVSIIVGYFYLTLFREDEIENEDRIKMASQVARATRNLDTDQCLQVIEDLPEMYNVRDLVSVLTEQINSSRMKKFNAGLLYSIIGGGWFGANAREVLAVAVEHPPTFIALVHAAINDRSYKRSLFAKMVQDLDRKDMGKTFTYNLARLPAR